MVNYDRRIFTTLSTDTILSILRMSSGGFTFSNIVFEMSSGLFKLQADIEGYGWRASYVLSAIPGFIVGILLATTVKDPFTGYTNASSARYKLGLLGN